LRTIDEWALIVHYFIESRFDLFEKNPAYYENSSTVFRIVRLVRTLQDRCGVRYDPAKMHLPFNTPFILCDMFIHSVIQGSGDTCASLPVIIAAVGRRLGYPIRLVHVKSHMFARWEDPVTGERINIEWGNPGLNLHPDDHYRKWPFPIAPIKEEQVGYLKSQSPREELAGFMTRRGLIWWHLNQGRRAVAAFAQAWELNPENQSYVSLTFSLTMWWKDRVEKRHNFDWICT